MSSLDSAAAAPFKTPKPRPSAFERFAGYAGMGLMWFLVFAGVALWSYADRVVPNCKPAPSASDKPPVSRTIAPDFMTA